MDDNKEILMNKHFFKTRNKDEYKQVEMGILLQKSRHG